MRHPLSCLKLYGAYFYSSDLEVEYRNLLKPLTMYLYAFIYFITRYKYNQSSKVNIFFSFLSIQIRIFNNLKKYSQRICTWNQILPMKIFFVTYSIFLILYTWEILENSLVHLLNLMELLGIRFMVFFFVAKWMKKPQR